MNEDGVVARQRPSSQTPVFKVPGEKIPATLKTFDTILSGTTKVLPDKTDKELVKKLTKLRVPMRVIEFLSGVRDVVKVFSTLTVIGLGAVTVLQMLGIFKEKNEVKEALDQIVSRNETSSHHRAMSQKCQKRSLHQGIEDLSGAGKRLAGHLPSLCCFAQTCSLPSA